MKRELTEEMFLKDVAEHKMEVKLDNGVHRCLKFASTGKHSWNQWFYLTTWPGFLCISGDMGSFVFSRLPDMFEFFRGDRTEGPLDINLGYWEEKCEAEDRRTCGTEEYSGSKFQQMVKERFDDYFRDEEYSQEVKDECWQEITDCILNSDNEYEAHSNLRDFEFKLPDDRKFEFRDTWEWDLKDYTLRFIWCCYAIGWGIRQYDLSKAPVEPATAGVSA